MIENPFFRDLAMVVVAALAGGVLARLLRQPLFIGYVIGGLLISPFTPGPAIQDVRTFEVMAQIGVVLLMFSIGIEFSLHEMIRLGAPATVGAPLTMLLVVALATAAGVVAGLPASEAAAAGIAVSVASTMVVVKLFLERGELHTPHARLSVATLLSEDLLVVVLIIVLPLLAGGGPERLGALSGALTRALVVLVPFFYLANRIVPTVLARVARSGNAELFILVAMAIGIGTAALSSGLGLSLALGAFLGGLIISESEFTHEILSRVLPMRDLFGALFFVSMGTLIRPQELGADLPLAALMLGVIVVGKFALRAPVLRLFRYPWPTAVLVSIHLAQSGEFSFVLAQVARGAGVIGPGLYHAILTAALLSILVSAVLSALAHRLIDQPHGPLPRPAGGGDLPAGHVVLCGFGRVGSVMGEALEAFGVPYTVIDLDFSIIEAVRARGLPCVYGDAASEPVLRQAGAAGARLAVVVIPDFERTRLAVRRLRDVNPALPILARSEQLSQRDALIEAGASEVIQPEFEAAQTLLRHGLERLGVPHGDVKAYMEQQRGVVGVAPFGDLPAAGLEHLLRTKTVTIAEGALADTSLGRARLRDRTGVWVVAVRRVDGTEVRTPGAETVLRAGDEVTVLGLSEQIARFEALTGRTSQGDRPYAPE
ncbi:MAG TPA: cation:proton antiporter [bacterium]|jgi:CPA2 family monovalent cation:H+ antiporter-2|nr:cation:proton antiporter [bacterium]